MRHAGQRPSTKAGRSAAPALLLAAALLLCHGVYGWYHEAHQDPTGASHLPAPGLASHEGQGVAGGAHTAGHAEGQEGDCYGCAAYEAVLLVLSVGALLLSSGGARSRTSFVAPPRFSPGPVPAGSHPARGPTLPTLQVFRL